LLQIHIPVASYTLDTMYSNIMPYSGTALLNSRTLVYVVPKRRYKLPLLPAWWTRRRQFSSTSPRMPQISRNYIWRSGRW